MNSIHLHPNCCVRVEFRAEIRKSVRLFSKRFGGDHVIRSTPASKGEHKNRNYTDQLTFVVSELDAQ